MRVGVLAILALALALTLCSGCAVVPVPQSSLEYAPELIDGEVIFGETIPVAPALDLLWVSPEMEAFVDQSVTGSHFSYSRFRRLMEKMIEGKFFIDQYERTATYTAAETFAKRKGNCIAYTNMFVALARQAGLTASYQLVRAQPTWDVESGFLIRNNHVNVLVERVRVPGYADGELTVDFNDVQVDSETRRRKITDEYAASMFYANRAIEYLQAGDQASAFAYTKRAILTEPVNVDLWNNLGALYSIAQDYHLAQKAYETALRLNTRDKTAVSGLVKSLRRQGRLEEAQVYARRVLKYQSRNPYYHYAVAEKAFHNEAFEEALTAVNEAIRLEKDNARFYALRAATAQELGDDVLVGKSIELQRKHDRSKSVPFRGPVIYD